MSKNWYPVINMKTCIECGKCINQCSHSVYDKSSPLKPVVVNTNGCIDKCHGCGSLCPTGSITYFGDNTGWVPPNQKIGDESDCGCGGSCDEAKGEVEKKSKTVNIDFLYLDLNICERCMATDNTLDEALNTLAPVLRIMNYSVNVNKVNITTKEMAEQYRFISSPTIRVNGIDICSELKESDCKDGNSLCGDNVDCRVFSYEGMDYEQPPVAMIVDGILRVLYGKTGFEEKPYEMSENLKNYFEKRQTIMKTTSTNKANSCCTPQTTSCCETQTSSCCEPQTTSCCAGTEKKLDIDFLYLDLTTCERCQSTDSSLKEALSVLSGVFDILGYDIDVNEVNITSRELAEQYRFVSSPTIRVNGIDINTDVKESDCADCGSLCGDSVDCRVFTYEGKDYEQPPAAMIVDGILRALYGNMVKDETPYTLPDNLEKFFLGVEVTNCSDDCGCGTCDTEEETKVKAMLIYEPAMCCPTGICGPGIDPELLRISAAMESLNKCSGVEVKRFNLTSAPQEFVKNEQVNQRINDEGVEVLPIIVVNGKIVMTKRYPRSDEFEKLLNITCDCLHGACPVDADNSCGCGCEDEKSATDESCGCGCGEACN